MYTEVSVYRKGKRGVLSATKGELNTRRYMFCSSVDFDLNSRRMILESLQVGPFLGRAPVNGPRRL